MVRPWTWWLSALLCGLSGVLFIGVLLLAVINRNAPDVWKVVDAYQVVSAVAYSLVGALIAARRPGNALGWLFLGIGLVLQTSSLASHWAVYGLETRPGAPGGALALWLSLWLAATVLAPTFSLLLFPAGRLPDRRARVLAWIAGVATATLLFLLISGNSAPPGFPALYDQTPNPLAFSEPLGDPGLGILVLGLCSLLSIGLLLARFRTARGAARQQYQWVVLAMALVVAAFVADFLARAYAFQTQIYRITGPALSLSITLLPVAMGVAILRHQLFDIDHVFNRVLVYAALSAGLLGAYAFGVVLLQRVLDSVTPNSNLAVAATTLLVAALFHPLRSRIQHQVDRRFNRAHYDATKMVETFSGRLRDEVDLDAIGAELQDIVVQTMQPTHVSLWLRPPAEHRQA